MVSQANVQTSLPDDLSGRFDCALQALTELVLGWKSENVGEVLRRNVRELGLKNAAYLRFAPNMSEDVSVLGAITTYSNDWQLRYLARRYHEIDPVLRVGLTATAPFDWRDLRNISPAVSAFFADADAHGVGVSGVTIPVRNRPKGLALVSFSSNLRDDDWKVYKLNYIRKLEIMAGLIDAAAQVHNKLPSKPTVLSRREEQTLIWAARGKTSSETAEILDLSYGTVRNYIESARRKLRCANLAHTVAFAVAIGLIPAQALRETDRRVYSEGN
jgi:DNA-binding CsgD family transcriptional regulator